ncbi:MAG TPA: penicillin acylase family protein, partial [Kofleriaceae bacterium]|nr:penicillin acylase family protein [Kofleriaceae bacterium]
MRSLIFAIAGALVSFSACGTTDPAPSLTITPSGSPLQIAGPTGFSAVLVNTSAEVTWTASSGSLSSDKGLHVVFTPPPGNGTASVSARAGDLMASVDIAMAPPTVTGKNIPGLTAPVTVQYDAQDIPHIGCAAMIDCIAVQGYLQARDRLFPMDFLRHVAEGRLAEMIGLDGLSQDVQLRTIFTTRLGHRLQDDLAAAQDETTNALLVAFSTGVNAYLAELRATANARLPAEYAQLPFPLAPADIEDWSPKDTLALGRLQQFQLSESLNEEMDFAQFAATFGADPGKMKSWIRAAAPPTEQAHTLSDKASSLAAAAPARKARGPALRFDLKKYRSVFDKGAEMTAELHDRLRPADASIGSNNWVVSAAKSATHVAMVANDPHLSLQYPPLFHLATMTSSNASDNLDITGGSFPGIPGALVGRGKHVGWGVTVVGYDVTDLYLEQFVPQGSCPGGASGPPCVLFGNPGVPVSLVVAPQVYKVRTATGVVPSTTLPTTVLPTAKQPPAAVLVVPHHGPIVQVGDAGKAVSVRWTGQEGNTHDTKAFLGLNTAVDVDAAMVALKDFATGAQNFVLADDQGHIGYDPHALVPVRNFAANTDGHRPWLPLTSDGSAEWGGGANCTSATLTQLPAACWIDDDTLPHGKDPAKGYYFTANADPTSPSVSDGNDPLAPAHLPYLSYAWSDSSGFRAKRIETMIEAAIAADGSVSLEDMQAIQSDHVSRPGMAFAPAIAALPTAGAPAELAAAQAVLAQWATNGFDCPSGLLGTDPKLSPVDPDPKVSQNSSGCFLFHAFLRVLFDNVFADDLALAKQGVNGLAALKAMLFMLSPDGVGSTSFCNDVNAKGEIVAEHTCPVQLATALVQTYRTLAAHVGPKPSDWVWGRVHT